MLNSRSRTEWEALIHEWIHNEKDRWLITRRLLDGVSYDALTGEYQSAQMNQNTCDITTAIHAEAEATRSLIQANEMQALRDKVSSLEMDNRMYGVVRYPNGYTYNAGNSPFCGNNCGCCC